MGLKTNSASHCVSKTTIFLSLFLIQKCESIPATPNVATNEPFLQSTEGASKSNFPICFASRYCNSKLTCLSSQYLHHRRRMTLVQNCIPRKFAENPDLTSCPQSSGYACLSTHGLIRTSTPTCRAIAQPLRNRALVSRQGSRTQRERMLHPKFWALYMSHLLSTWGDKMWEFTVPFLLLGLNRPDTMTFVGIYAFCTGAANIAFGPIIGYLVDKYPRLQALIFTLLLQNVLISISFLFLYSILSLSTASGAVGVGLIIGVVTFCAVASLASTARYVLLFDIISGVIKLGLCVQLVCYRTRLDPMYE